jgi:hypothetical protein
MLLFCLRSWMQDRRAGRRAFALIPVLLAALWLEGSARAQATAAAMEPAPPRTSLVIFSDRPLPDGLWEKLTAAVRRDLPEAAVQAPAIDVHPEFVRGDTMPLGERFDSVVVVFLHGDCNLINQPPRPIHGEALGWVWKLEHQIQPFIHVDCTLIGQMLGPQAERMSRDDRTSTMSEAISRVVLHEWVHIATQSAAHGDHGITKSVFGVNDLMPKKPGGWALGGR